ncbi:MAG: hypothetical protein AB1449_04440 [Chloroflexota bacterium]
MATIPIVLLLLGALATWLARRSHERFLWGIATGTAVAVWAATLGLGTSLPSAVSLSVWRPTDLFAARLELVLDPIGWSFSYSTATLLLAVVLTGVARPGEATPFGRAMMLGYTALGLVAMLAGNLLTVATAWALMDVATAVFLLGTIARGASSMQGLVSRLAVDTTGVVLVVAAAVADWGAGGDAMLAQGLASGLAAGLLSLAVLLRLGLMPPHFILPALPRIRLGLGTLLRLVPPAAGLCVLGRALEPMLPAALVPALRVAGVLGVVVGGFRWAMERDPIGSRRFLVLGLSGVGILAMTAMGEGPATMMAATGALLLLGGGVVSLGEIHTPAHRLWLALGALLLAGLPGSVGGRLTVVLGSAFSDSGSWWVGAVGIAGLVALASGSARSVMAASTPWPTGESLVQLVYGAGLALPSLAAVGLGLWSRHSLSTAGVVVFLIGLTLAASAFRLSMRVPGRRFDRWQRVAALVDPEPFYRFLWAAYRRITRWMRTVTAALEGGGAMLWTYVVLLLVVLSLQ